MAEVYDLSALPSQLQPNQYGALALLTLFSLSQLSMGSIETGVGPYQMAFIALAVWYGPLVIKEDVIPRKYQSWAILVGMVALFGPWKLALGDFAQPYHLHSILLALLVYYTPDVLRQHILGAQNMYVLGALAYFFAPSSSGKGALFEPYLQWFVVAAGLFVALIFTSTNLGGPLRWAYPEREMHLEKAKKMLPSSAHLPVLVLIFHPWTRWWLIPFILAASWQYLRFHYNTSSHFFLTCARSAVAGATADASLLQSEAASLERLSLQAHTLAANLGRDAMAAHHIRLTDFYIESTHAWAKLGDFRTAIDDTTAKGKELHPRLLDLQKQVESFRSVDSNTTAQAKSVYAASKNIAYEGDDLSRAAKQIQAKTERFKRAAKIAENARAAQKDAATEAAAHAGNMGVKATAASKNAWNTEAAAEQLRAELRLLEHAIGAGDRAEATKITGKIKMEAARLHAESKTIQNGESVQKEMLKLYEFRPPALPPPRDQDSDEEDNDEEESD